MELDNIRLRVTKEMLYAKFSQEQIMEFYFGEAIKLKQKYKNPFRNDKFATCPFFYKKNGQLVFMDFSVGKPLTCIDMAELRHGRPVGYQEIYYEMSNLKLIDVPRPTIQFNKEDVLNETVIKVEVMPYDQRDLEYWAQFNISLSTLKHFNVRRVRRAWINGQLRYINLDRDRCYRYVEGDRFKLYRPHNKKMKFRNNYVHEYEGLNQLPLTGNLLVITKSMKDIMTLHSIGITAVCPHSESAILSPESIEEFVYRFQKVCIWYDADPTGQAKSLEMHALYKHQGVERLSHDAVLGKDVSDIVKEHGIEKLKEVCKQLEIV
jgi:hypothetical protein